MSELADEKTAFAWVMEAPGPHYLSAREIGGLREQVARALEGLAIEGIFDAGSVLHIRLARDAKMPALTRLATLGDTLRDLHVREPSLEDVFFGYRN
mgnify:CR=1 FL=1